MDAESLFSIASYLVLPGWLLLVVAPRWKASAGIIAGLIIPVILGLLYVYLAAVYLRQAEGGFGSLADVATLFQTPQMLLAGWIHYLAFDLFIGAWEVRDAQRVGLRHLLVVPCLVLTFLLGPIGLLLYLGIRMGLRRRFDVWEETEAAAIAS